MAGSKKGVLHGPTVTEQDARMWVEMYTEATPYIRSIRRLTKGCFEVRSARRFWPEERRAIEETGKLELFERVVSEGEGDEFVAATYIIIMRSHVQVKQTRQTVSVHEASLALYPGDRRARARVIEEISAGTIEVNDDGEILREPFDKLVFARHQT